MQVLKLVVTVIDFDGLGADGVKDAIENARYPNRCISPHVRSVEVRDIGEWSDGHPLNNRKTADDELLRLFGEAQRRGSRARYSASRAASCWARGAE